MGSAVHSNSSNHNPRPHQQRRSASAVAAAAAMSSTQSAANSPGPSRTEPTSVDVSASTPWAAYLGLDGEASGEEIEQQPPPPPPTVLNAPTHLQVARRRGNSAFHLERQHQLQNPSPGFSQSLKRKLSNPEWPRTAPLKSSKRRSPDSRPADTITINGEVYDRRRRPGSFDNTPAAAAEDLDLHLLPHHQSYYPDVPTIYDIYSGSERSSGARDAFNSYRCTSPSNVSAVTSLQSPPRLHARIPSTQSAYNQLFDCEDNASFTSGASYAFPSGASAVGNLASPTSQMRLASALGQTSTQSRAPPSPQRRKAQSDRSGRSPALSTQAASSGQNRRARSQQQQPSDAPPPTLLPLPPPSPTEVAETTLTGSSGETKPKPKRIRKRAPAKGTPQAAMSADPEAPVHVARPPNAWILYRSDQLRIIRQDPVISKKPQADISKLIGALWREEKAEVKLWYEQQADIKKTEHLKAHPEYRFAPQRKDKRRPSGNAHPSNNSNISASSSSNNTVPVNPQARSLGETTPASTPTSGVSPPQHQHDQSLLAQLQNPELCLQRLGCEPDTHGPDQLPLQLDLSGPVPPCSDGSPSNAPIASSSHLGVQDAVFKSLDRRSSTSSGTLTSVPTQDASRGTLMLDVGELLDMDPASFNMSSDSVWSDFMAGHDTERAWLPYGSFDLDPNLSQTRSSASMTDRTYSSQSRLSSAYTENSEPVTPAPSGFSQDSYSWAIAAQDDADKLQPATNSETHAGDGVSWSS